MNNREIKNRLSEVVKVTALSSKDHDFMATHMPFKKLKYADNTKRDEVVYDITEEEFLTDKILRERDKHKLILVKGNAGSGKSHLIRWFHTKYKNRIDENEELIILISRDSNNLKSTLNQIVSSELFKGFHDEAEFKKIIDAGNVLERDTLREKIPGSLISAIRLGDLDKRHKNRLANFINTDIIREKVLFRENGPIDRIIDSLVGGEDGFNNKKGNPKFTEEDFEYITTQDVLRPMRDTESELGAANTAIRIAEDLEQSQDMRKQVARELNDCIDYTIQDIIQVGQIDLQEAFKKIRTKLNEEGMYLTIFFEDITTTTGIHRELLETLLVEHTEENGLCRIMSFVGITEGYFTSSIQKNIEDRITDMINIGESSLINDKDDFSKFIGLYMNAINQPEEKIKDWYKSGKSIDGLPVSSRNQDKEWSLVNITKDKQVSIYPFTEDMLWNIYNNSKENEREARGYLTFIFNGIYNNYLEEGIDSILNENIYHSMKIPMLKNPLDAESILRDSSGDEELKDRIVTLIKIWGNATISRTIDENIIRIGNIDEDIFGDFKLPIIGGDIKPTKTVETDKKIKPDDSMGTVRKGKDVVDQITLRQKDTYQREMEKLEQWRKGEELVEHVQFRDALVRMFKEFINWEEEGISKYILDTQLSRGIINIEGQRVRSAGIEFKRDEDLYYVLVGFLNWKHKGESTWNFEDSNRYILYTIDYLEKYKAQVIKHIKEPVGENWKYEDILLMNSYYFNILNKNIHDTEYSMEELYLILFRRKEDILNKTETKNEKWDTLQRIYNGSVDLEFNQEILLKYFNLPLGTAASKDSDDILVYAFKIICSIKKLSKDNWNLDKYKINIKSQSQINIPLIFCSKEVKDKIPTLIKNEEENLESLLKELEKVQGDSISISNINNMQTHLKEYLKLIDESKLNYSFKDYTYILKEKDLGKKLTKDYEELKSLKELEENEKLIKLSSEQDTRLIKYRDELTKLSDDMDRYDNMLESQLKNIEKENIKYEKISDEIQSIEKNIVDEINKILEVI